MEGWGRNDRGEGVLGNSPAPPLLLPHLLPPIFPHPSRRQYSIILSLYPSLTPSLYLPIPQPLPVLQILFGGDRLEMCCIVIALCLPKDFYRRPDVLTTTQRVDMGVLVAWGIFLAIWVGNGFDKWGYAWHEEYSAVSHGGGGECGQ